MNTNTIDVLNHIIIRVRLADKVSEKFDELSDIIDSCSILNALDNLDAIELKVILNHLEAIEKILHSAI